MLKHGSSANRRKRNAPVRYPAIPPSGSQTKIVDTTCGKLEFSCFSDKIRRYFVFFLERPDFLMRVGQTHILSTIIRFVDFRFLDFKRKYQFPVAELSTIFRILFQLLHQHHHCVTNKALRKLKECQLELNQL